MKLSPLVLAFGLALGVAGSAAASPLFSDDFQSPLGAQWAVHGSGQVVASPVGGGNALHFNSLDAGGDLFSTLITSGPGTYHLSFDYLGTCQVGGCGGYIGLWPGGATATDPGTSDAWLASDTPAAFFTPFVFSSNGAWTTVSFDFKVTSAGAFGLKLEDFSGSGGVAGDAYFRNLILSTAGVPEPAAWAMMILGFAGLGSALRRGRAAAA